MAVVVAIVAASILVAAITVPALLGDERGDEALAARFSVSSPKMRLGETVVCLANESEGDIDRYRWDYGDGNSSSGTTGHHTYEFAGWYNITLTVFDGDRSANTTVTVGVQLCDFTYSEDFGEIQHWFSNGRMGTSTLGTIGPSIGRPTVQARFELDNAVGEMDLEIDQRVGNGYRTVCSHKVNAMWEDVDHTIDLEPELIYKTSEHSVSTISAELWITNGQVKGGTITLDVVFPFEELAPPEWS